MGDRRGSSIINHQSSIINHPRGFTLIEILLTLLLTSLVLVALAMAIDFQLRVVERGRGHVEEAQLARVLLHRIADDLRGAVPYDPLEMQKLVSEAISSAASAATDTVASAAESAVASSGETSGSGSSDGAAGPTGTEDSSIAGDMLEDLDLDSLDDRVGTTSQAAPDAPQSVPGLYGESNWIQVDVSRLPRLDQFANLTTSTSSQRGSTTVDRLSDVKTVTYYAIEPEDGEPVYAADGTPSTSGLVRRELDRAVASWSSEQGGPDATESDDVPLAPEVAAIEFRYSDGGEWVDSWDSDEAGALPAAVEITLSIIPTRRENEPLSSPQASTDTTVIEEESFLRYRLIVHLLGAQASSGGESSGETEESTAATESTETGVSSESTESTGGAGLRSSGGESAEEQSR